METAKYKADVKLNKVFYLNNDPQATLPALLNGRPNLNICKFAHYLDLFQYLRSGHTADVLLLDVKSQGFEFIELLQQAPFPKKTPIILIAPEVDAELTEKAQLLGVDDIFATKNLNQHFLARLNYLVKKYYLLNKRPPVQSLKAEVQSDLNRVANFILASTCFIILSPLMAVVAALIKLESEGPVFKLVKRMGAGGKIFQAFKFRTTTEINGGTEKFPGLQLVTQNVKFRILGLQTSLVPEKGSLPISANPGQTAGMLKRKNFSPLVDIKFRETIIGEWLRQTGLEELPMVLNMIKGDIWFRPQPLPALYYTRIFNTVAYKLRFANLVGRSTLTQAIENDLHDALAEMDSEEETASISKINFRMQLQTGLKFLVTAKKNTLLSTANPSPGDQQMVYN